MTKLVSTKTELTVLRGLCSKNKRIAGKLMATTDETYFHNEEAIDAYKKIRRIVLKSGEPPVWRDLLEDPSLSTDTREFLSQNKVLIRTPDAVDSAVAILNKYRRLRGMYLMGESIIEKLQEKKVDEEALLERLSDTITKLRMNKSLEDVALHFGKNNNSYELVKSLLYEKTKINFVPTGFRDFDTKNGGFFFKSFVVIGGTSGGGKSALANQMAMFWAKLGLQIVLVPLEMSKIETTGRMLANISEIDVRKILLQRLTEDERKLVLTKYKRFVRKAHAKDGRYTLFKPPQDMTIEEVLSVTSVYGPKIVIVDYISLLKTADGDRDDWKKLGDIARYCKVYAANNDVIIIMLAQVSEEGKLKYSQTVKEHADYAWIFVSTKETRENEIINIEQLKGRNAELFPFSLRARLDIMRIGDLSHEEIEATKDKKKPRKAGSSSKETKPDYIDDISESE